LFILETAGAVAYTHHTH